MSLGGALQIGRSGLLANQAAIEVAGHNLANVATRGYHRQTIGLAPATDEQLRTGVFIGRGVQIQQITRQVDEALEGRVRNGVADESASAVRRDILTQIEALQNELSDNDLSSHLSEFFNAWSELANNPLDNSVRTVVVQEGAVVADFVRNLRSELSDLRAQVDKDIDASASAANDLLTRIETLNQQIARADGGNGGAGGLRDQRDELLSELSAYLNVSTVEQPSGAIDVFVGSLPVILNGRSRGLEVERTTVDGELNIEVRIAADDSVLTPESGRLGALIAARSGEVNAAIDEVDAFANQLIYQVNRVHSQGQGSTGFNSLTGTTKVQDAAAALNTEDAGIDFAPTHGSFQVHVKQKSTGQILTTTVNVDLDGINAAGDTSLNGLAASLDAIANVNTSITSDGRLRIDTAGGDFEISFSGDTSGAVAALGLNSFFDGSSARDIDLGAVVRADPSKLAAAQGNLSGDNRNALAIAGLRDRPLSELGGLSLSEKWSRHVEEFATRLGQATQEVQAATVVRESLETQKQSVSGVNTDEEAINLLQYQRAYQGSARFLSVVDELFQTLIQMV